MKKILIGLAVSVVASVGVTVLNKVINAQEKRSNLPLESGSLTLDSPASASKGKDSKVTRALKATRYVLRKL